MRIIKLTGGLGNQMFQYAYGRAQEIRGKKIIFDISFFHGHRALSDTVRNFELFNFNLMTKAKFSPEYHPWRDVWYKVGRRLKIIAGGYWQNEKYFIGIGDIIRREFTLKKSWSEEARAVRNNIENSEAVSIHLRRGDYVNNPQTNAYHGICELDYYQQAIKIMKERLAKPIFFIFSDDPDYARKNFSGAEFIIVSSPEINDTEDLLLMSGCRHQIIANSSFSWWGAWLNDNPEKIVIAPKRWFNNKRAGAEVAVPSGWLKI